MSRQGISPVKLRNLAKGGHMFVREGQYFTFHSKSNMCFVGTDGRLCISFWWETIWLLNFSLSWHVGRRLGSSSYTQLLLLWAGGSLESVAHPCHCYRAGQGQRITALGVPPRHYSRVVVHSPCTPDCFSIPDFSMQLYLSPAPSWPPIRGWKWWILALIQADGSLPESLTPSSRGLSHAPALETLQHHFRNQILLFLGLSLTTNIRYVSI